MTTEHKGDGDITKCSIVHTDLNGLGYVHPVDLNMGKTSSWYILKVLLISVEEVCCIYANTYCPLNENRQMMSKTPFRSVLQSFKIKFRTCTNKMNTSHPYRKKKQK